MSTFSLKIKQLQIEHPEYKALSATWRTIGDLKDGVGAIKRNIEKYLPKRPSEDNELYQLRLAKLSYTGILSDSVNKYSSKLAGSPVHLSGGIDPFWEVFRGNNANPKSGIRKESNLLKDLFGSLLYFGRTWAAIDRPDLGVNPKSAYEARGLQNNPFVCLYDPLEVIYWADDWAVSRQIYPLVKPFENPKTIARWTYWGLNENIIYESEVTLKATKDSEGNHYDCISQVRIGNEWMPWESDAAIIEPTKVWNHGLNIRLISTLCLPSEQWVCNHVYNKQIQHLRIENAWTDAGYLSGIVQRIFTPPDVPPADDPRVTYDQPDYAKELSLAGNQHILIGNGYAFVESTGAALGNLQGQLDKIENQIKELVSLHFASGNTSVLNQSGASKAMDMSLLEDSMKSYGQQVLSLYNSILRVVSKMLGLPEVTAIGLSSYSTNNTDDLISQLSIIEDLPYVPSTAKKIAYGKLAQLLTGSASPEDERKIKDELDQLFMKAEKGCECDEPAADASDRLQEVVDDFGLTEPDYEHIYGEGAGSDLDVNSLGFTEEQMGYILNG